ncbi:Solute carrier family 13 member 3 [Pseudolycoriella hygida]|uniref:Solute carrier family 13 member 3 n=1 Tax=Pseudolycoriella hygida TaxID=35572 RepID=A0A9Q0MSZ9_9DIPT|nr:Solute carrier family 13 member 3 [Pseudolycoriella hygida]
MNKQLVIVKSSRVYPLQSIKFLIKAKTIVKMLKWSKLRKLWKFLLIIITPLVLLPVLFLDRNENVVSKKFQCAYVILLMSVFWMLEVMPLSVTSLLPVVLFPFLGIQSTGAVVSSYMRETAMMFIGGISLALGIQYCGLHKRIALKIILTIGSSPWRLLLGILVTAMSISCVVIVNTAVVAMMVPIINGIIECFDETESIQKRKKLKKLYFLAVGYAANVGGTATIIGSQSTLIFKELIEQENISQNGKYTDMNFATYIAFSMPIAVINLFLIWMILSIIFLGRPKKHKTSNLMSNTISDETNSNENSSEHVARMLQSKLDDLGKMSFHEWTVTILITTAVILWLFRDPRVIPGWITVFPDAYPRIGDSTIAVAILILIFAEFSGKWETALSWQFIQQHFPWHVLFIVGGGLAISDGANASGLSVWLGDRFNGLENLSPHIVLLIVVLLISFLTELMSNTAAVSLLTPILIALSKRLNLHPLYLSLPGAIACQYAFMLPTASPPNTIVFASGEMNIIDMAKPGLFINLACVTILYVANISWGQFIIFDYNNYEYPK